MAEQMAGSVADEVVKSLMGIIKEHLRYLTSCTEYVTKMRTKMNLLNDTKADVEKHEETNRRSNLEIPTHVPGWLKKVEKTKADVDNIHVGGCFNIKARYKAGKRALKITQAIECLIKENSETIWTNHQNPLGRWDSSTSAPSSEKPNNFKSRDPIFNEALKALQPDDKTSMIALCGMGGVGKSTMMEQLRTAVDDKKLFDWVFKVVIGEKTNPIDVQQAVADYMSEPVIEKTREARADRLRRRFKAISDEGKKNILVILDDVWERVNLEDIGLSPLPNQGVGFKFLLTSRDEHVCTSMGVDPDSIFKVKVISEPEAQNFFRQLVDISNDVLSELHQIGEEIVRRCGGLPIAIKTIASTLKNRSKYVWDDALSRLEQHDHDGNVVKIFEMSYNLLKKEAKAIFLLCGLFPAEFNIPIEDLMRYGWGLKLFSKVSALRHARNRANTCVEELRSANLFVESNRLGCVKMHDLVRAFALSVVSEGNHAWSVGHSNMSKWTTDQPSEFYERMSLTCTGMPESFLGEFNYTNLAVLKLMHGDKSLTFPDDFYGRMKRLEVIAFDKMICPLLPGSLPCSPNIRTFCLGSCLLIDDLSPIGNLVNLEILSFAQCRIRKLPSTIRKLTKLKLLDLTGCVALCIDDGVFGNLVQLEELYMRVVDNKAINFTEANCSELQKLSKKLDALEMEFFNNRVQPKNVFFNHLIRFRISVGCYLDANEDEDSFKNTLKLVTSKAQVLESKINELFGKTEVLHLQVDGMNDLQDVMMEPLHPPHHLFHKLRVLSVSNCGSLRYLFSLSIAEGLFMLEHLTVSSCPLFEELIHVDNTGAVVIKFPNLKSLSLYGLPELVSLCKIPTVIELPELVELKVAGLPKFTSIYPDKKSSSSVPGHISAIRPFLNEEVAVPKLEILKIERMKNLQEIWPCQFCNSEDVNMCRLRVMIVKECDSLVHLFPTNPIPLLHYLQELHVRRCCSVEVIFELDLECIDANNIHEGSSSSSSNLRMIVLRELRKLREVWRVKGVVNNSHHIIHAFQDLRSIVLYKCESFRHVFTPTIAIFDLGGLEIININDSKHLGGEKKNNDMVESSWTSTNTSTQHEIVPVKESGLESAAVVFPSHLIPTFHHLQNLYLRGCKGVEVVFEIESASSSENQQLLLLPHLKKLNLRYMKRMSQVWKCKWNMLLLEGILQQEAVYAVGSAFHNLTSIQLYYCGSIKYLLSPLMAKLLSNLKDVTIVWCDGIEEVVSNRDDDDEDDESTTSTCTNTAEFFPHMDTLKLLYLPSLKRIGGGGGGNNTTTTSSLNERAQVASWSLCQYSKKIMIEDCKSLSSVIPAHAVGQLQKLEELEIKSCNSMLEVFESEQIDNCSSSGEGNAVTIPRLLWRFPNLTKLEIYKCDVLRHIFTCSVVESLKLLKQLKIKNCRAIQVIIVKGEEEEHTTSSKVLVFPCLQSLELDILPNLKGFFLGMNEFQWPLLYQVKINDCPEMMVFTSGHSTTPKLNYIYSGFGKHNLEHTGLNFDLTTVLHQTQFPSLGRLRHLLQFPCSFSNMIKVNLGWRSFIKNVIPSNELQQLQKLEKLKVIGCWSVVEVFEVAEGTSNDMNEIQSAVRLPKLTELRLVHLESLKYIWKSHKRTVLEFPNLTRVSIERCKLLGHVFTCSMVGSLLRLQELHISDCTSMDVIVKEEDDVEAETRGKEEDVTFPCLKSLKLEKLPNLKGVCLGKEAYRWPSLDTLEIKKCPEIMVFTCGQSVTPVLKVIDTSFGLCYAREDPNSFIKTRIQEGYQF